MTIQDQYQEELKKSDHDHHVPTAGAMTGHIIANLAIHTLKINQALLFANGPATMFLEQYGAAWQDSENRFFCQLTKLLTDNGESIPTTSDQIQEFTMLKEDGAEKYLPGNDQLFNLIKDFDTQTLFITKAIQLAQNENWPELADLLTDLLGWIKHQIAKAQRFLGHDLREGLYTEEDDDDDF